jgi:hypothetical protein
MMLRLGLPGPHLQPWPLQWWEDTHSDDVFSGPETEKVTQNEQGGKSRTEEGEHPSPVHPGSQLVV